MYPQSREARNRTAPTISSVSPKRPSSFAAVFAALAEVRHAGAGELEGADEADVDDQVPVLVGELPEDLVAEDAGVVEDGVDAAGLLDRRGDHPLDVGGAGDVSDRRGAAGRLRRRLDHVGVGVDHPGVGAAGGEGARALEAYSAAGAGDDHRLAWKS